MIVLHASLWPDGDALRARPLGVATLALVPGSPPERAYDVTLRAVDGSSLRVVAVGRVEGCPDHQSLEGLIKHLWPVLTRALVAVEVTDDPS